MKSSAWIVDVHLHEPHMVRYQLQFSYRIFLNVFSSHHLANGVKVETRCAEYCICVLSDFDFYTYTNIPFCLLWKFGITSLFPPPSYLSVPKWTIISTYSHTFQCFFSHTLQLSPHTSTRCPVRRWQSSLSRNVIRVNPALLWSHIHFCLVLMNADNVLS